MSRQVTPARRRGLADEVADRVRDAIFDGAYPPGGALREVELAAALGVSRGPVREALLKLEREGLVRGEWHRGTTVTSLTDEDVAELDSLRAALERLAVERVIERGADLAAVDAAVRAMERAADEHEMVRCDLAFHDAVYEAACHRRLREAWEAIRSQVHLFLLTRVGVETAGYLAAIPAEHRRLAEALRARDRVAAAELFAEHRRRASDILAGRPQGRSATRRSTT